jgi:flagellar L-ring protein precursor FlgH
MKIIYILSIFLFLTGCATLKSWMGISDQTEKVQQKPSPQVTSPRFSETQSLMVPTNRQYKRMTKSRLEEESEVHSQAGSMWVMEGQGAYLFAQNKSRRDGDLLNIRVEGSAQKQVETKVSVIKKLLKQLEEEQQRQKDLENPQPQMAEAQKDGSRAPASAAPSVAPKKEEKEEPLNLDVVPTRIVERLADGNYRVKGSQPFMIGKREYKVIVTGLVRPEDFNDQGVSSNVLLDPQFDVVSLRKKEM